MGTVTKVAKKRTPDRMLTHHRKERGIRLRTMGYLCDSVFSFSYSLSEKTLGGKVENALPFNV